MLMSLGLFVFELASAPYDELTRTVEWRHAMSDRTGARAASQFLGPGEDNVNLSGAIVPEIAGNLSSFATLREMADAGDAYELVDGIGNVWGSYVIKRLDERRSYLHDNGVARRTDFAVDLTRVA